MNPHFKTLIIGAGGGGISSALLASLRGDHVTVFESHSALGGCASWFRRGKFIFDAGATTLSGVGVGEPLGDLFEMLGSSPELYASDPGIVFHLSSGKVIRYHRDFDLWMKELTNHFPGLSHRPFWELVRKINHKSWALLKDVSTFPFVRFSDLGPVLKHPGYATLVPYLLVSTEQMLKRYNLDHPEYLELVNGILIISAQAYSQNIPFIVGSMALSYPAETYAPVGGMKGLMDFFQKELSNRNITLLTNTRIDKITSHEVITSKGETYSGDRIIVNLPVWNMARMTEGNLREKLQEEASHRPGSWGAFTLYFGVPIEVRELYQQIHLNHPLVKNYFVSFSIPGDLSRAPEGFQSVSISTHVVAEEAIDREKLSQVIMDDFRKRFHVKEVKFLTSGTPKTFERYTGRQKGFVGGLPFLFGKSPLKMLSPVTEDKSIFRVGDTVFPGQGICGVVAGSLQLHRRLTREL